jgi:MFS family permease
LSDGENGRTVTVEMRFSTSVRERQWPTVLGYVLFVALMVAGYYYNLTLVQLGLIDLGTRLVGMSDTAVSAWMAALALCTLVVAVATGVTMDRRGWSRDLRTKLRLLFGVVVVQFALTLVAPAIRTVPVFGAWIVLASIGLGVGFPVSFSLAIDLVPVSDRGYVAAMAPGLVVLYGQLVFGYLIGIRLPIERAGIATVAGIGALLLAIQVLGAVPYLGDLVQFVVIVVGFGAVLNTYFGLQRFDRTFLTPEVATCDYRFTTSAASVLAETSRTRSGPRGRLGGVIER